jgi:uncharacterized membrane protein
LLSKTYLPVARRFGQTLPWLTVVCFIATSVFATAYLLLSDLHILQFVAQNEIAPTQRSFLLASIALPPVFSVLAALFFFSLRDVPGKLRWLELGAKFLSPLILSYPVLTLAQFRFWIDRPLEFLVSLAIVLVIAERLFRLAFEAAPGLAAPFEKELAQLRASRVLGWAPLALVIAGSISFTVFLAYFSIQQHLRIESAGFDLGHYENVIFNALHGNIFRSTILWGSAGGNNLANHAEFGALLFLPFYAIHPSAEAMLLIQAVMMGASVIPLYFLARTALSPLSSLAVSGAYLMSASLVAPLFYDFHWLPLALPFIFLLMFALNTRRYGLAVVAFVLTVLIREDVAISLALGSTYFITSRRNVKLGLVLFAASVSYFGVMKFVVMPMAGTFDFGGMYGDLIPPGETGFGAVIKTVLTNPMYFLQTLFTKHKLIFTLHLVVPLAFLPWRNWKWALFSCGGFVVTLMTSSVKTSASYTEPLQSIRFHYVSHWIPYLFAATIVALNAMTAEGALGTIKRRAALATVLLGSFLHSLTFGPYFQRTNFTGGFQRIPFEISPAEVERAESMRQAKLLIPDDATVAATDKESAQVATRLTVYSMKVDIGSAEYLLINRYHLDPGLIDRLSKVFSREPYGLLFERGEIVLFKRGHENPETQAAAQRLGIIYAPVLGKPQP